MSRNSRLVLILMVVALMFLAACDSVPDTEKIPNPASVFCVQNGGKLEMRQDASGATAGICVFPDGSECEEWAFFRKECQPGESLNEPIPLAAPDAANPSPAAEAEIGADGWKVYRNADLGYQFHYPVNSKIVMNDELLNSLSIIPDQESAQGCDISISHPSDRLDYRPPEGADLPRWLADHNLMGENRQPDIQIAGTIAVHFRHERSPQSYAMDRYYFAHNGQLFMIIIGHTGESENWDFYNHFLESFQFEELN